ncbi:hypothetical protein BJ508DRAFT_367330 [Ascobolus immersus RN42]|uniref:OTU domain-containing protein n=1 Tax=Ascobolus immersus RN42 TaxID=1160509 RepID=A0A3N4HJC5_ASCIM|nr:hypothetical protein BJ508DRAFT_367330 [Ascobolus immersus RN42]
MPKTATPRRSKRNPYPTTYNETQLARKARGGASSNASVIVIDDSDDEAVPDYMDDNDIFTMSNIKLHDMHGDGNCGHRALVRGLIKAGKLEEHQTFQDFRFNLIGQLASHPEMYLLETIEQAEKAEKTKNARLTTTQILRRYIQELAGTRKPLPVKQYREPRENYLEVPRHLKLAADYYKVFIVALTGTEKETEEDTTDKGKGKGKAKPKAKGKGKGKGKSKAKAKEEPTAPIEYTINPGFELYIPSVNNNSDDFRDYRGTVSGWKKDNNFPIIGIFHDMVDHFLAPDIPYKDKGFRQALFSSIANGENIEHFGNFDTMREALLDGKKSTRATSQTTVPKIGFPDPKSEDFVPPSKIVPPSKK